MRLIDADALMRKCNCKLNCSDCDFYTDGDSWCKSEVFGVTIMQMPTIDAVPVIRCKNCAVPHNKYTGCPELNGLVTPPDFFCPFGEQKKGE